jgi:hypothetical protein
MRVALRDGGENKVEAPRIVCRLLKERSARSVPAATSISTSTSFPIHPKGLQTEKGRPG